MHKNQNVSAENLGSRSYKDAYNVKYAYSAGSMYRGISSPEMVIAMAKAGFMGYLGSGGLSLTQLEQNIKCIQAELEDHQQFGVNILFNFYRPEMVMETINFVLGMGIKNIEASAFIQVRAPLVKFRARGLKMSEDGKIISEHRIQVKLSRPEVAKFFLSPAPDKIIDKLVADHEITKEQAFLLKQVPVATEICVEADSGGHTDRGVQTVLVPFIKRIRDDMCATYNYREKVSLGVAGGIGTPESAAAAFFLGADYIQTGSINQCTPESGTSDLAKDMLSIMDIQDTAYAPAGDGFEMGGILQVMKKGVLFPIRANRLFELYKKYGSLDEIDAKTKQLLEKHYYKKSLAEVYEDCVEYHFKAVSSQKEVEETLTDPKTKMILIFKSYYNYGYQWAYQGEKDNISNFHIQCGPALGAFNQWVLDSELENWRKRKVDRIALRLLEGTAELINSTGSKLFS